MYCETGCTTRLLRGTLLRNEEPSTANSIRERKALRQLAWRRLSLFPRASLSSSSEPQRESLVSEIQTTKQHASPWIPDAMRLSAASLLWFMRDLLIGHEALAQSVDTFITTPALAEGFTMSSATQGVLSAFLLILFSEIGDKTFFVALILSLQNSKSAVFTGTFGALGIMTLISVGLGQALHQIDEILPESVSQFPVDDILAIALLVWFGFITLRGARNAEALAAAEKEEAEKGVETLALSSGGLILSTFALVFSAEWGDKSFLATTALSAASSPLGVTIGAIVGHFAATILAVLSGSVLSNYISEKSVQYVGGSLFLLFALTTTVDLVQRVT